MGGTGTGLLDGLGSAIYNPATLGFHNPAQSRNIALFFNPIGGISALSDRQNLSVKDRLEGLDWLNYAGLYMKALAYSSTSFTALLVLSEQLTPFPVTRQRKNIFSGQGILDSNYSTLSARLRLANQVAIGVTGFLFTARDEQTERREPGTSYGVFIQPSAVVSVGVVYFDLPDILADSFRNQSRFEDQTVNVGLSYQPFKSFTLALDLRNVSEEEQELNREFHVGVEYSPLAYFALRTGFYRKEDTRENIYSCGLGLLDSNLFHGAQGQFVFRDFSVNYGLQIEQLEEVYQYNHFLSMLVRF
jgi:hypothetical protein